MHNRKKLEQPLSESERKVIEKKIHAYSSLVNIIFSKRSNGDFSLEALNLVGKLLRSNPDFYSLWNYRREILYNLYPGLEQAGTSGNPQFSDGKANEICKGELGISTDGIMKNPKSYGAWHHRQWVMDHFHVDCQNELKLCAQFLMQDQRNFHCWNYRRSVIERAEICAEAELEFSTNKISENFSNYSAFHHRSLYIVQTGRSVRDYVEAEFAIVESAIFTEPDDQSAWWYHQFLLMLLKDTTLQQATDSANNTTAPSADATGSSGEATHAAASESSESQAVWAKSVMQQQMVVVKGLLDVEPGCRWAMNCLVAVSDALLEVIAALQDSEEQREHSVQELVSYRQELLQNLQSIDPTHKRRYEYMMLQPASSVRVSS